MIQAGTIRIGRALTWGVLGVLGQFHKIGVKDHLPGDADQILCRVG